MGVRGDLLHRRLPRADEPARPRRAPDPDPRDGGVASSPSGLDPERCTLFVQSHRPEATELAWLLTTVTPVSWLERTPTYKEKKQYQPDDVNHGLLTYPVLQAADIVIYKASLVPGRQGPGRPPRALARDRAPRSTRCYGDTFPEPQAVHTEAPIVLGTDGVKKMSKSLGQHHRHPRAARGHHPKQVMSMVTDTKRILRTDPGRPEVCNVCQLHRFFGDDFEEIWDGERTARTGCVDTKKLLAERIIRHYARGPRALRRADGRSRPASSASSRTARSGPARSPRRRWPRSARRWGCGSLRHDRRPRAW